ncbi:MAG: TldD/PmbA family protein [Candidatus Zixiibacteriota bacterium]
MSYTRDEILQTLRAAISRSSAEQTELTFIGQREASTRFAENVIHQNMLSEDGRVTVRIVNGGRVAVSSTNDLSTEGLERAIADAIAIAAFLEPDESFPGLAKSPTAPSVSAFFESTASLSAEQRALSVREIVDIAKRSQLETSGLYRLQTDRVAVVNSLGTEQYFEGTAAELSVSAADDKELAQGWGIGASRDVAQISAAAIGKTAVGKANQSRNPVSIEPGEYTVILEPAAVGQMLLFLGFLAFSGKSFAQGRGILSGRMGEQVAGTNITIHEDPFMAAYPGIPFDFEGVPKQNVTLIENGIAKGVVHDRRSAAMAGAESTGHALPADNARGPYPKNMVMATGDASLDDMIRSTTRGLLITHFWYINYLNPMRTQISGSTRDGTFLIENGEITTPVQNMRATPSILESFSNVEMLGLEPAIYPQYSVVMSVPAMKIAAMPIVEDTA